MTCFECGAPACHNHHVVPRSSGGTRTVPLCDRCHSLAHHARIAHPVLTRAALAAKRARGERVGEVPFGLQVAADGVHLVAHPDEVRAVSVVHELRAAGLSIRDIAAELNARGIPARGERWHPTTVARLLKSAATRPA